MAGTYRAVVKGTYGVLPRGFPWIFLVWYAVMAVIYGLEIGLTSPAGGAVVAVFVVAAAGVTYWTSQRKHQAFAADAQGIWLGVRRAKPAEDRRKRTQIPWSSMLEIRVSPIQAGSAVDIVLSGLAARPAPAMRAIGPLMLVVFPPYFYWQRPAILEPLADPVRYHAPLFGAGPSEVAAALRALAPASVPVTETSSSFQVSAK